MSGSSRRGRGCARRHTCIFVPEADNDLAIFPRNFPAGFHSQIQLPFSARRPAGLFSDIGEGTFLPVYGPISRKKFKFKGRRGDWHSLCSPSAPFKIGRACDSFEFPPNASCLSCFLRYRGMAVSEHSTTDEQKKEFGSSHSLSRSGSGGGGRSATWHACVNRQKKKFFPPRFREKKSPQGSIKTAPPPGQSFQEVEEPKVITSPWGCGGPPERRE